MSYECYRSCMDKMTREYYDSKMEYKKNLDLNDIILKNRKLYESNEHELSNIGEKLVCKKKFFTKPIQAQIVKDINPIKTIRVADYIFPLDSCCLSRPMPFNVFHGIDTIKRAIKSEYDLKEGYTTITIEEKYLSDQTLKGGKNLQYFTVWLKSLGDYRASNLSDQLTDYIKSLYAAKATTCISSQAMEVDELCLKSEKIYLKKLTDEACDYIKARPYLIRITSTNVHTKNGTFNSMQISDNI